MFEWQALPASIDIYTDSDWAGCKSTCRSTSGGIVRWGKHCLKSWSSTQATVALSSADAELYALIKGAAQALGIMTMLLDLGSEANATIHADASAAIGIVRRTGLGKLRHLNVRYLWLQDHLKGDNLKLTKVAGAENPSDLVTKHLSAAVAKGHLERLCMRTSSGRAATAPTVASVTMKILSAAHVRETAVLYQPGFPSPGVARAAVTTGDQQKLSVFSEKRPMSSLKLLSTSSEWEYIETILDSGATVTVIPPHVGRSYEVVPSAASRAGVKYEVANGDEIPNLGEKLMPVMTREGSMRGLRAQVADVSKALQSVRALVKAGHVVIFGDGEQGECHYVYNKFTGETNEVTDDGINYLMGMYIIPPDDASFGRPAN